jgi:hypothetical protein
MRARAWLLLLPLVGAAGCAPGARSGNAPQWVLVRSPMTGDLGIPIYAWEQVRTFPTAEECSTYHAQLLENAVSAASREKLQDAYTLHCVPAAKMVAPAAK